MNSDSQNHNGPSGPISHYNWRVFNEDDTKSPRALFEYPVYSDVCFVGSFEGLTGESTVAPHDILNTVPGFESRIGDHALTEGVFPLVLRIGLFYESHQLWPKDPGAKDSSDADMYTNLSIADELACLLSVLCGRRLRAGESTRDFWRGGLGMPRFPQRVGRVYRNLGGRAMLPSHCEAGDIGSIAGWLESYPLLSPDDAIALLKACRFYREAVCIAEVDPEQAWIMLVSAVEALANQWHAADIDGPVESLLFCRPQLHKELAEIGQHALDTVAEHTQQMFGATKKFMRFLKEFYPKNAPPQRPAFSKLNWSWRKSLEPRLRTVYEYRSRYLHAGIPLPHPMLCCARREETGFEEMLVGNQYSGGGSWNGKDIPMFLHVLEYIVRGAIMNWWKDREPASIAAASEKG